MNAGDRTSDEGRVPRWAACTIAARNYLATVSELADSMARHHPDIRFIALLVDADPDERFDDLGFETVALGSLSLNPRTLGQMQTYYDVTEFSTALKPTFVRDLLDQGLDVVMYLDPDVEMFAPVPDLFELAEDHGIVLTPHVTRPVPRDGLQIAEEAFLISGQFNLGFLAVSAAARPFLDYWAERTRLDGICDPANGYFVDQRWCDVIPSMFDHVVVRDLGCNVAYWNLHERPLARDPAGDLTAGGVPLRFFHYSGHDAHQPLHLSRHLTGPSRVRVDQHPVLRDLLKQRSARVLDRDSAETSVPYGRQRSADGVQLSRAVRRAYRDAVVRAERDGRPAPAHAFDGNGRAFTTWLEQPIAPGLRVSRHLHATWSDRPDLRAAFPDPLGADAERLLTWARTDQTYLTTAPGPVRAALGSQAVLPGVNLVGYLAGEFGVGMAGRMVARMIRASGIPLATTTLYTEEHHHRNGLASTIEGVPFSLSVFSLNADGLVALAERPDFAVHRERARVGIWYWEVGTLPAPVRRAYGLVDEIWCASEHVRAALAPGSDRPVRTHPLVFEGPLRPTALRRGDLGLPEDRFLFGFAFDYASVFRRKNPLGLLDAYQRAFGPDDGAALVLKTTHAHQHPQTAAMLQDAVATRPDVVVLDRSFDDAEMRALYQLLDCYVSLHRSEGLGLTLASAMTAGTATIATGWSGNLEFMDERNSILVPYEMVPVGPGAGPYDADAWWAEPDLDVAAASMRRLFDDGDEARALGATGRASVEERHSAAQASEWFAERFADLVGAP